MLVLTRKLGEKVCIGADITVTVLDIRGQRVRIGIEAQIEVPIARAELGAPRVQGAAATKAEAQSFETSQARFPPALQRA
jgi:carbon storage regulator